MNLASEGNACVPLLMEFVLKHNDEYASPRASNLNKQIFTVYFWTSVSF